MWRSNSKLKASASVSMTSVLTLSAHSSKKTLWSPSSKHSIKFFYKDVNKDEWVNKQELTINVTFAAHPYKILLGVPKKQSKLCYLPQCCKTLNLWKHFLEALRLACLCFCTLFQIRESSHQTPQTLGTNTNTRKTQKELNLSKKSFIFLIIFLNECILNLNLPLLSSQADWLQ